MSKYAKCIALYSISDKHKTDVISRIKLKITSTLVTLQTYLSVK